MTHCIQTLNFSPLKTSEKTKKKVVQVFQKLSFEIESNLLIEKVIHKPINYSKEDKVLLPKHTTIIHVCIKVPSVFNNSSCLLLLLETNAKVVSKKRTNSEKNLSYFHFSIHNFFYFMWSFPFSSSRRVFIASHPPNGQSQENDVNGNAFSIWRSEKFSAVRCLNSFPSERMKNIL